MSANRVPANEFAIPRMEPGQQRPIQSMEEARHWERLLIGEIVAGRDPTRRPSRAIQAGSKIDNVSKFLDAYVERCVKPSGLRSIDAIRSRVEVIRRHFGSEPLGVFEDADEINRFKIDSDYAESVEVSTITRVLETIRSSINWGMAQTPRLFNKSPFHRFGVRLNKKDETIRDRRLLRDEEKKLLDTALQRMNTPEHGYVGPLLHDRIIGALELCCRRSEMLMIQNKPTRERTQHVDVPPHGDRRS